MSERIILRTGEALVEGPEDYLAAEPEVFPLTWPPIRLGAWTSHHLIPPA